HEHNFSRLRHTQPEDFPVEKLASFAVMQLRGLRANDVKNHAKEVIHCLN
ncbi:hypothetical protein GY512_005255, partial [Escherichia coli]|nr:hypothetical protein [Escherichia coli]